MSNIQAKLAIAPAINPDAGKGSYVGDSRFAREYVLQLPLALEKKTERLPMGACANLAATLLRLEVDSEEYGVENTVGVFMSVLALFVDELADPLKGVPAKNRENVPQFAALEAGDVLALGGSEESPAGGYTSSPVYKKDSDGKVVLKNKKPVILVSPVTVPAGHVYCISNDPLRVVYVQEPDVNEVAAFVASVVFAILKADTATDIEAMMKKRASTAWRTAHDSDSEPGSDTLTGALIGAHSSLFHNLRTAFRNYGQARWAVASFAKSCLLTRGNIIVSTVAQMVSMAAFSKMTKPPVVRNFILSNMFLLKADPSFVAQLEALADDWARCNSSPSALGPYCRLFLPSDPGYFTMAKYSGLCDFVILVAREFEPSLKGLTVKNASPELLEKVARFVELKQKLDEKALKDLTKDFGLEDEKKAAEAPTTVAVAGL